MAKRFTDTGKWEDPWFTDLPSEHKLLWIYILDKCDQAGIWKVNKRLAEFCLGITLDLDAFLIAAGERISVHRDRWLINKFITFQYGDLTEKNKMYGSVMSCFESAGLKKGDKCPIEGAKDKDKDKEKVKEVLFGKDVPRDLETKFESFWATYPPRDGKKIEKQATKQLFLKLSESDQDLALVASRNYANSGRMPKDPKRFLQADFWRDWIEPPTAGGFRTDRRPGASPAAVRKDPELYECFVCKARVPEADRRMHMDKHESERFKAPPITLGGAL